MSAFRRGDADRDGAPVLAPPRQPAVAAPSVQRMATQRFHRLVGVDAAGTTARGDDRRVAVERGDQAMHRVGRHGDLARDVTRRRSIRRRHVEERDRAFGEPRRQRGPADGYGRGLAAGWAASDALDFSAPAPSHFAEQVHRRGRSAVGQAILHRGPLSPARHEPAIRLATFPDVPAAMALWEVAAPHRLRDIPRAILWTNNRALMVLDTAFLRLGFPLLAVGLAVVAKERQRGPFNKVDGGSGSRWSRRCRCSTARSTSSM